VAKARSIILNTLLVSVISLSLLWLNTLQRQHEQYTRGVAAWKRGDVIAAIAGYESAIHMCTPGSPVVGKAAAGLWDIGETMERKGDSARALLAYRSLRSSFYAVRGLTQPGQDWIARCDARIAALAGGNNFREDHVHKRNGK
jgi:hypothetical protein